MRKLINNYDLCPKLCFMQIDNEPCVGIQEKKCFGACEQKEKPENYNKRVENAIEFMNKQPTYIILDKGLQENEKSCILVENGRLSGMGYIQDELQIKDAGLLKDFIKPIKENSFLHNLLAGYAARNPSKIILI